VQTVLRTAHAIEVLTLIEQGIIYSFCHNYSSINKSKYNGGGSFVHHIMIAVVIICGTCGSACLYL
jgi:hypothetical protein